MATEVTARRWLGTTAEQRSAALAEVSAAGTAAVIRKGLNTKIDRIAERAAHLTPHQKARLRELGRDGDG
jgi:hypothetical protein